MAPRDVDGKQGRRRACSTGSAESMRVSPSAPRRGEALSSVDLPSPHRDLRGQPSRAPSLPRRRPRRPRDRNPPPNQLLNRASIIASSSSRGRAKAPMAEERERRRVASGFVSRSPHTTSRHQASRMAARLGSRGTKARLADFIVELGEGHAERRGRRRGVERAQPLIAGMLAREGGAMLVGFRQRAGAERAAGGHGAAIRAAATRRSSDRMTLYTRSAGPVAIASKRTPASCSAALSASGTGAICAPVPTTRNSIDPGASAISVNSGASVCW